MKRPKRPAVRRRIAQRHSRLKRSAPIQVMMHLIPIVLLAATAAAAVSDVATGKISNWLSYPLAAVALLLNATSGPFAAIIALCVMIAVLAASLPVFSFGLLRGGDVKMIVACCGLVSYGFFGQFILYTMLAGGAVALAVAWRFGTLKRSLQAVGSAAHPLLHGVMPTALPFTTNKIPYGLAIFAGALLTTLAMTAVPALRL